MSEPIVDDLFGALIHRVPRAVVPVAELAAALGITQVKVRQLVKRAEALDLAVGWHEAGGVVLSMTEAARHGLELRCPYDEDIDPDGWRWIAIGKPDPTETVFQGRGIGGVDPTVLDSIAVHDHILDPDDPRVKRWLEHTGTGSEPDMRTETKPKRSKRWSEWADFSLSEAISSHMTPRINAVGQSETWSPALEVAEKPDCEVCGGRRLSTLSYCLGCCRSGLDGVLPKVKAADCPKVYQPDPDGLAGGVESVLATAG